MVYSLILEVLAFLNSRFTSLQVQHKSRESMNLLVSRQEDQFRDLQSSVSAKLSEAIRDQISALPRWPPSMERTQQQLRTDSIATTTLRYKQPEKSALRKVDAPMNGYSDADPDSFADKYAATYAVRLAELEEQHWRSLWFPVIEDREEQISIAELKTFDWILRAPQGKRRTWDSFIEWLEHGGAIYWVNGKAGSGKSTLMKYLKNHDKVKETLKSWADGTSLVTASFFFWYNGNILQNTQEGLLRSLLYQSLENHRELIPIVLSEAVDVPMIDLTNHWTLPRLKRAFKKLVEQKEVSLKICLLVDGLDEYTGNHSEIAEVFRYVAEFEHIKVCISSRPLLPFDRAFKDFPGLMLQNLTFDDIEAYVKNKFNNDDRFKELEVEEPELGRNLTLQVVNKASGVFLWVKLVVHSLLEGIQNFDRGKDLERRLNELPEDLTDLYWHMLDRVRPAWYLEEGFKLLLLVYTALKPLTLLQLAFSEIEMPAIGDCARNIPVGRQNALCKRMAGRIKSRCLGLLEVTDITCKDEKYRRVQFLHKSVKDFIETPRIMGRIQDCLSKKEQFMPEIAIIQALSTELRTVKTRLRKDQFCEGDGLTREAWFDEVRPIVFEAVRYAAIAESKTPNSRKNYSPLITEVDRMTADLWDSVSFRAPEEITGSMHWSVAPRKPWAARRGNAPNLFQPQPNTLQTSELNDDAKNIESLIDDKPGSLVSSKDDLSVTIPPYPSFIGRPVRFAGLPTQYFPGEEDDEHPRRRYPAKDAGDLPSKLARVNPMTNAGFENFLRKLGLTEYANERFGIVMDVKTDDQAFKMGIDSDEIPLGSETRVRTAQKSFRSKLKSLWSRKR